MHIIYHTTYNKKNNCDASTIVYRADCQYRCERLLHGRLTYTQKLIVVCQIKSMLASKQYTTN